jgi:hypothetical protein
LEAEVVVEQPIKIPLVEVEVEVEAIVYKLVSQSLLKIILSQWAAAARRTQQKILEQVAAMAVVVQV